jgi:hypothetical protein
MAFNFFGQSMVDALVQVSDGPCRIFKMAIIKAAASEGTTRTLFDSGVSERRENEAG